MKRIKITETDRAMQYGLWKDAVMPMVTVGRVFDITHLVRLSKKAGMKLNVLMNYCIGMAMKDIPEFYHVVDKDTFMVFDRLNTQVLVHIKQGGYRFCDVPFSEDIREYERLYMMRTNQVAEKGEHSFLPDLATVATSALALSEIDTFSNQYSGFNFPFLCWGRYRKNWWGKCSLQVFIQFHHIQMDGAHVAVFFNNFQSIAKNLQIGK